MTLPARTSYRLETLIHYLQPPRSHPGPVRITPGIERVEVVTGGRGWVHSAGEWVETTSGDIWWHVEGDETIGRSDFRNPYRCLNIVFSVTDAPGGRPVPHGTRWVDLDELLDFTTRSVAFGLDPGVDREALQGFVLGRLLIEARRPAREGATVQSAIVRRARQWLEAHSTEPVRIGDLAQQLGYSAAHLHERFRAELGSTPYAHLMGVRIRAARERLALTSDPVKVIAVECGFSHAAAFCYSFRRATGESPGAFRARQRALYLRE
jgi:AraC-like DNA-binding protein